MQSAALTARSTSTPRTFIRKLKSSDIEMLWRECRRGRLTLPVTTGYGAFMEYFTFLINQSQNHWIGIDCGVPIGIMFCKTDGWTVEPHGEFFNDISAAAIYRVYRVFLDGIADIAGRGTCLLKSDLKTKNMFDKLCKKGYVQYVGEIPNGQRDGDLYLYCTKQKRRGL